jgi:F-type H+-transporting ATPase subunit c
MLVDFGKVVGARLATSGLAGAGVGNIFGSLLLAIARNPGAEITLTKLAVLGFALTEALALFCL